MNSSAGLSSAAYEMDFFQTSESLVNCVCLHIPAYTSGGALQAGLLVDLAKKC